MEGETHEFYGESLVQVQFHLCSMARRIRGTTHQQWFPFPDHFTVSTIYHSGTSISLGSPHSSFKICIHCQIHVTINVRVFFAWCSHVCIQFSFKENLLLPKKWRKRKITREKYLIRKKYVHTFIMAPLRNQPQPPVVALAKVVIHNFSRKNI